MKDIDLNIPGDLLYAVSNMGDGNLSCTWGDGQEVVESRKAFLKTLNLSMQDCINLHLEHGDKVFVVDKKDLGRGMECGEDDLVCDALVTKAPGVNLFLLTADCIPAVFFDQENKVLGVAHLSSVTSNMKLAKKTIDKMCENGAAVENIRVYTGPCIQKESYVFDKPNHKKMEGWDDFLTPRPDGNYCVDLVGYNKNELIKAGIKEENIFISKINTATSSNYFSHYRSKRSEEPEGRFATVVGMKST